MSLPPPRRDYDVPTTGSKAERVAAAMLRQGQHRDEDKSAGPSDGPPPADPSPASNVDIKTLTRWMAELEERQQSTELQASALAEVDVESRRLANEITKEKANEIKNLRRTRNFATGTVIFLIVSVMMSFGYSIFCSKTIFKESITDPWVRLSFVAGHFILLGVMVAMMLRSLYAPSAKEESPIGLSDFLKAVSGALKGGS